MLTEETIVEQLQADPEMMAVLAIIRDLDLADAWLAAVERLSAFVYKRFL